MRNTDTSTIRSHSWNKNNLNWVLAQFSSRKILVIGDVGVDQYTLGCVERISPEAPVPVVLVKELKLKLGLAANVADNIKALGGTPFLAGVVGKDRESEDFRKLLKTGEMSSSLLVVDPSRRTALKERVVSEGQQLLRIDFESLHCVDPKIEKKLLSKVRTIIRKVDAVIVEDYAKGILTHTLMSAIFRLAKKHKKMVIVDPNSKTPVKYYHGAFLLTPNTREAEELSGIKIRDPDSLIAAGRVLLKLTGAEFVIITRGKEGMAILSRKHNGVKLIPTYAREVYDVSGAGDTVSAVLALALSSGASIEDATVLGNLAAGVEVGKRGTATVSPQEIRMALDYFEMVGI